MQTATVHPFEAANLGRAPFSVVGYAREVYQACHGAPVQPGGMCDYCGAGLVHVYRVRSSDGKVFDNTAGTPRGPVAPGEDRTGVPPVPPAVVVPPAPVPPPAVAIRSWFGNNYPDCRIGQRPIRIATAPELWFEKPGNSPPAAPPAEERGPTRGA
jgi:hypothetical protein